MPYAYGTFQRVLDQSGGGFTLVRRERGDGDQSRGLRIVPAFGDDDTAYEWPKRITGPSCAARARFVTATSSANEIVGFWTIDTAQVARHLSGLGAQHVQLAHHPCAALERVLMLQVSARYGKRRAVA
jgi:hypothetical protein